MVSFNEINIFKLGLMIFWMTCRYRGVSPEQLVGEDLFVAHTGNYNFMVGQIRMGGIGDMKIRGVGYGVVLSPDRKRGFREGEIYTFSVEDVDKEEEGPVLIGTFVDDRGFKIKGVELLLFDDVKKHERGWLPCELAFGIR